MYQQLIPIIAPVLICALLGYGWARTGMPFEREFLTRLIMNIGVPCLILNSIVNLETDSAQFFRMVKIGVVAHVTCAICGTVILKIARQPLRSFLPPVVFGNAGNLGIPLCLFAFGPEGLGMAVAVYLVGSVAQFVIGPLFQGREPPWQTLIKTPTIYAAVGGIALLVTDATLPLAMINTLELLGGLAIPLMLLALGNSLANFRVQRIRLAAGIASLRLGLGFLIGVSVAEWFELSGVMRGVIIIETAMPLAVFNFLLAARYHRHPEDVAGAILVSTVASFLTMPALILFALNG